jgi:hypothetical protein
MLFARERASDQAFKTRNVEAPTDQDTPGKVHMASHGHSLVSLELAKFVYIDIVHDPLTNLQGNVLVG